MTQKHENGISYLVRKAAYTIHVALGPGLLESVYETLLALVKSLVQKLNEPLPNMAPTS